VRKLLPMHPLGRQAENCRKYYPSSCSIYIPMKGELLLHGCEWAKEIWEAEYALA
jgi:hypothetical protein